MGSHNLDGYINIEPDTNLSGSKIILVLEP